MWRSALLLFIIIVQPALAATKEELEQTKKEVAASKQKQEELQKAEEKIGKELGVVQEKLVQSAKILEKHEVAYSDSKQKLSVLNEQLAAKNKALVGQRAKLEGLMQVAVRLSRTPPEAMVLMPTEGKKRVQAAYALSMITEEVKKESREIQEKLHDLQALERVVKKRKSELEDLKTQAQEKKKSFEASLQERKKIKDSLASQKKAEANKAEALAKKAKSLEGFFSSLRNEDKKSQKAGDKEVVAEAGTISGSRGKLRAFSRAKGDVRVPVSGRVVSRFGEKDSANDTSKGITIAARNGAMVIAPYDGEVAYSGSFLNYGRMVILKHSGDYHTLLAGLSRIDVATGDFLLEGEPIGAMGDADKQRLYVELREKNQPVDPANWMSGL